MEKYWTNRVYWMIRITNALSSRSVAYYAEFMVSVDNREAEI